MRKTNVILMSILAWTSAVAVSHAEGSNPTMYSETGMFEPRIVLAQAGQDAAKKHMEEGSRGVTPQPLTSGQMEDMRKHNDEMEAHMRDMQALLDKIAATKDPQERRALMEEHRGHMQEMMRTMRSTSSDTRMGMMGGGPRSGHAMPEGETLRQHLLEKRLDMMDMMMDQMTKHSEMMRSTSAQ